MGTHTPEHVCLTSCGGPEVSIVLWRTVVQRDHATRAITTSMAKRMVQLPVKATVARRYSFNAFFEGVHTPPPLSFRFSSLFPFFFFSFFFSLLTPLSLAPPPRRIAFILHRSFLFFIYQNTRRTLYFVQRFRFAFRDTDASIFPAFLFQHIYFTTIFRKRDTPIVNCSTS